MRKVIPPRHHWRGAQGASPELLRKKVTERVPKLPHRRANLLFASKLYLILPAGHPNDNTVVVLRHKTLSDKSGAQTNQIRAGISLLAAARLIHVITEDIGDDYRIQ